MNGPHHAQITCPKCGAFVQWAPKPETIERQKATAFRLAKLAMVADLTDWEKQFVADVSKHAQKLSPKQQAIVDRLCTEYLSEVSA
jgi:hypothetical protein